MPSITRYDVSLSTQQVACSAISNVTPKEYYTFTMYDKKTLEEINIDIFPGKAYRIVFYNTETQGIIDTTGQVIAIDRANITIESIRAIDNYTCLCERRKYLNNVVTVYTASIPITNIYSITPVKEEEIIKPLCPKPPTERTVTVVGVLGISAEIVRAVVVRLRVYSDDRAPTYEAVPVDMKVGSVYKVTYFNRKDGAVYEVTGKLLDIQESFKFNGDDKLNGFVREEDAPPHEIGEEILGYGNTIYDRDHFFNLSKKAPEAERIYFILDTSDDFSGTYDKVWLKDIRNVSYEYTPDEEEDDGKEPDKPVPPPPPPHHHHHEYAINEDFPNHTLWDGPPAPVKPVPPPHVRPIPPAPPMPPNDDITHVFCPLNLVLPVSECDCSSCQQVDVCRAFEAFCNGE